jgi:hypothetical protein
MNTKAKNMIDSHPAAIVADVNAMTTQERGELARELEYIAANAAFAAAYLSARYGEGCGDQGHAYAVKCANRAKRLVRKAFGYDNTPAITF